MKKILILSVTAGNGHNACAKFVKEKMEELAGEEVEVKIVDTLKTFSTKREIWTADTGYNISVSKFLPIYHMCFKYYKNVPSHRRWVGNTQKTAKTVVGGLLKEILEYKPDVIFCTHFYPAIAITDLKLVYNLPCKVVLTSLDYENSPFWESAIGVDYFNVPAVDFVEENIQAGFKKEQMLTLGIPVDERTLVDMSKVEARRKLGIKEDVWTAMVQFGGGHWSGGMKIFKNLIKVLKGKKAQIIMINGRNEKDFKRIEKMKFPEGINVVNYGFIKEVPTCLAASDIVLNKCGGLCATEMLNVGRPMVITEKIPTQELYNLDYFKSKGCAMSFKNKKELAKAVNILYDDMALRYQMEERFKDLRTNGCLNIAKLLLSFDNANYDDMKEVEKQVLKGGVEYKDKICKQIRKKVKKATKEAHKKSMAEYKANKKNKGL